MFSFTYKKINNYDVNLIYSKTPPIITPTIKAIINIFQNFLLFKNSISLFKLNVYKTNQYYDSTKDYYFIDPANFFHFFSCLEPKYIK